MGPGSASAAIPELVRAKLDETLKRLDTLVVQARREWGEENRRFQAAEKAFLAWRLAVKAVALLALQESSSPKALLKEIEERLGQGRGVVATAES